MVLEFCYVLLVERPTHKQFSILKKASCDIMRLAIAAYGSTESIELSPRYLSFDQVIGPDLFFSGVILVD